MRNLLFFCFVLVSSAGAQSNDHAHSGDRSHVIEGQLIKHGTCASVALNNTEIAFVIDSRITTMSGTQVVKQEEGCKVALLRPTILVAATGIEDALLNGRSWNSLDEARRYLQTLPEDPTSEQLYDWAERWSQSMWAHFRHAGTTPSVVGDVAQLLLITKIKGESYVFRPSVTWDGSFFGTTVTEIKGPAGPLTQYSGLCRGFVTTHDQYGAHPRAIPVTDDELEVMDRIGSKRMRAQNLEDLKAVAMSFEIQFTAMDERREGNFASIAGPYATAEWDATSASWKTSFNPKCYPASATTKK